MDDIGTHDRANTTQPAASATERQPAGAVPLAIADPMPVRPAEPDGSDCCGEGCIHCVMDRYDEALERYRDQLAAWQSRHAAPGGG